MQSADQGSEGAEQTPEVEQTSEVLKSGGGKSSTLEEA